MGALAIALILLYELSVQVTKIHDRRLAKRQANSALSDDQASPLSELAGEVGSELLTQPIGAPTSIGYKD
jgi:sec-independent protein translocase protein TatC